MYAQRMADKEKAFCIMKKAVDKARIVKNMNSLQDALLDDS